MDNFKLASKQKLRFKTNKGLLSTEQLWDLSLEDLNDLAVSLDAENAKEANKKSFLVKTSTKDKATKLSFDVALDVLNTKIEEAQVAREAFEIKENRKKILNLISEKKEESLKGKTIEELEAMLK